MIFTWTLASLAALVAAGACIIYWDKIKKWAQDVFDAYPEIKIGFANLYRDGKKLLKVIIALIRGKFFKQEGTPEELTLEQLREAYERGELTKEQYEALLEERRSTQIAELRR